MTMSEWRENCKADYNDNISLAYDMGLQYGLEGQTHVLPAEVTPGPCERAYVEGLYHGHLIFAKEV